LGEALEFHGVGVADREISVGLDFSRSIYSAGVVQDTKKKIKDWRWRAEFCCDLALLDAIPIFY
jgi:hypothetical protein